MREHRLYESIRVRKSAPGLGAYKSGQLGTTWTIQMSDFRLVRCLLLLLPLFTHPVRGAGAREAST